MDNFREISQPLQKEILDIALAMKDANGWRLNNAKLYRMVQQALPYIVRAKSMRQKPTSDIAQKVLRYFYMDRQAVFLLMYGDDCPERNRVANIYNRWIRTTIGKNFGSLAQSIFRDLEDIVADCWIDILENLSSFNYLSKLHTWIVKVTINRCLLIARKTGSIPEVMVIDSEIAEKLPTFIDPVQKLAWQEWNDEIQKHIMRFCHQKNSSKQVDLKTRLAILEAKFIKGMQNVDIAKKLDVKEGTVGSFISRFRNTIPKEMIRQLRNK